MKRATSLALVLVTLLCLALPAAATEVENAVQPRFTYILSASADLQIDSWGVAACSGHVSTRTTYPVKLIIRLQQQNGTSWTTVKDWDISGTIGVSDTKYYAVYKGYTYRTAVIGVVYDNDGKVLEVAVATKEFYY